MTRAWVIVGGIGIALGAGYATWRFLNRLPSAADPGSTTATILNALDEVTVTAQKIVGSDWPYPRGREYQSAFEAAEQSNDIPPGLLARQAYQESHFRDDIISGATVSKAGAVGIMQIVPRWHPDVNAYDPLESINYAAHFLAGLHRQFGTWPLALAAYNWGPGNVAQHKNDVMSWPLETQNYVRQITADVNV